MMWPTNALIECALKRSMQPVDSGDLLDLVVGLGEQAGWPHDRLQELTRQMVARRMRSLIHAGHAQQVGVAMDEGHRRTAPTYAPTSGYDPDAEVPSVAEPEEATADVRDSYADMTRPQLLAVLDTSDEIARAVGRFLRDMQDIQHRARRALSEVGLEPDA